MNELFFLSWTDKTDREKDRQGQEKIQTVVGKTHVMNFPFFVVVFALVFVFFKTDRKKTDKVRKRYRRWLRKHM